MVDEDLASSTSVLHQISAKSTALDLGSIFDIGDGYGDSGFVWPCY